MRHSTRSSDEAVHTIYSHTTPREIAVSFPRSISTRNTFCREVSFSTRDAVDSTPSHGSSQKSICTLKQRARFAFSSLDARRGRHCDCSSVLATSVALFFFLSSNRCELTVWEWEVFV